MELRQLQTFQAVVREGSFLRAAGKLDYAQSTVTLHIQQLEAELGVQLFARGRRVQLTQAGRVLAQQAGDLLARESLLRQTMSALVEGEAGHLRIGAIEPTASLRLPDLLVPFCRQRPQVRLTLEVGGSDGIAARVASGDLDVGFASPPNAHLGLDFEPLFTEELALLAPVGHPLATAETIEAADLKPHRLLVTEPHCAYRQVIERALLAQGTNPFSGLEIGSMEAIKCAVQRGLGAALVPVVAATPPPPGTVLREIAGLFVGLPVGLVSRPDAGPPAPVLAALLGEVRSHLRGREGVRA